MGQQAKAEAQQLKTRPEGLDLFPASKLPSQIKLERRAELLDVELGSLSKDIKNLEKCKEGEPLFSAEAEQLKKHGEMQGELGVMPQVLPRTELFSAEAEQLKKHGEMQGELGVMPQVLPRTEATLGKTSIFNLGKTSFFNLGKKSELKTQIKDLKTEQKIAAFATSEIETTKINTEKTEIKQLRIEDLNVQLGALEGLSPLQLRLQLEVAEVASVTSAAQNAKAGLERGIASFEEQTASTQPEGEILIVVRGELKRNEETNEQALSHQPTRSFGYNATGDDGDGKLDQAEHQAEQPTGSGHEKSATSPSPSPSPSPPPSPPTSPSPSPPPSPPASPRQLHGVASTSRGNEILDDFDEHEPLEFKDPIPGSVEAPPQHGKRQKACTCCIHFDWFWREDEVAIMSEGTSCPYTGDVRADKLCNHNFCMPAKLARFARCLYEAALDKKKKGFVVKDKMGPNGLPIYKYVEVQMWNVVWTQWTCQSKWVVELRTLFATQAAATTLKKHFSGMRNDRVGNGLLVLLNTIWFEHRELLMGAIGNERVPAKQNGNCLTEALLLLMEDDHCPPCLENGPLRNWLKEVAEKYIKEGNSKELGEQTQAAQVLQLTVVVRGIGELLAKDLAREETHNAELNQKVSQMQADMETQMIELKASLSKSRERATVDSNAELIKKAEGIKTAAVKECMKAVKVFEARMLKLENQVERYEPAINKAQKGVDDLRAEKELTDKKQAKFEADYEQHKTRTEQQAAEQQQALAAHREQYRADMDAAKEQAEERAAVQELNFNTQMSEKMSEMSAHLMSEMRIELANYVEEVDNMSGPQLMTCVMSSEQQLKDAEQQLKDAEYSHGNQRTSCSEEALLLATQHIGKLNKFFQVLKAQVDKNEAEQTKGAADTKAQLEALEKAAAAAEAKQEGVNQKHDERAAATEQVVEVLSKAQGVTNDKLQQVLLTVLDLERKLDEDREKTITDAASEKARQGRINDHETELIALFKETFDMQWGAIEALKVNVDAAGGDQAYALVQLEGIKNKQTELEKGLKDQSSGVAILERKYSNSVAQIQKDHKRLAELEVHVNKIKTDARVKENLARAKAANKALKRWAKQRASIGRQVWSPTAATAAAAAATANVNWRGEAAPRLTLEKIMAIRDEVFLADDVDFDYETMSLWSVDRLISWFEKGGREDENQNQAVPN